MTAPGESHFSGWFASFERGGFKIRYFAKKRLDFGAASGRITSFEI
jgi:hypothetical protein